MTLNLASACDALQRLNYQKLYLNELGWNASPDLKLPDIDVKEGFYSFNPIAEMSGIFIIEVYPRFPSGKIPEVESRKKIALDLARIAPNHLLIFLNGTRTQSLWHSNGSANDCPSLQEYVYTKNQAGERALGKLESMLFEFAAGDKHRSGIYELANKLKNALNGASVTKRFYGDFNRLRNDFTEYVRGIDDERERRWYVSLLLNRLIFIYFLQRQAFLDGGELDYLQKKLLYVQKVYGPDQFYTIFLRLLFFEGFTKPRETWNEEARSLLGRIQYLNGELFSMHSIEQKWPDISIPDRAFTKLLELFSRYHWNLKDTPSGMENELRPHVLGSIFEKYINQKSFGAYYTPSEITEYLCERTIHEYILQKMNTYEVHTPAGESTCHRLTNLGDLLLNLDASQCRKLLGLLPTIHILDPACGSGAFLVSALYTLVDIYSILISRIETLHDSYLTDWLTRLRSQRAGMNYSIRKRIIAENIFGVDLMEEAIEIAKLRLSLALISSVDTTEQLEPLPRNNFTISSGNALIGFLHLNSENLPRFSRANTYAQRLIAEKKRLSAQYTGIRQGDEASHTMHITIYRQRQKASRELNNLLLEKFRELCIKYEEATWDESKQALGKTAQRELRIEDIVSLQPFHWGYEFAEIMDGCGGFDIIITNPPWEALKPQAKEFFSLHEHAITKKKMRLEDFEQAQSQLLQNEAMRKKWLAYRNTFPYQSAYFRVSSQYPNQISMVNGKKQGTDINLYKLFTEQCYNLLREDGLCGLVVPSGIYTDLGSKQLREMLFSSTRVTGLFCFENSKAIFEGVHRSFKFVVLTYQKGSQTTIFPAAFTRHEINELASFPQHGAQYLSMELIRQLSPSSLSLMELKNERDIAIARKAQQFPPLGEKHAGIWNVSFTRELDMTNDHHLFKTEPGPHRLPLYEGKMIHQFTRTLRLPRYWVEEKEGRAASFGRIPDRGQKANYQYYRLGYRSIGRTTDQRALIASIVPAYAFAGNSLILTKRIDPRNNQELMPDDSLLFVVALMNSFVLDYLIGQKISANLNMFYIYQLPVPRLTAKDASFNLIVQHAARLICTTEEFANLWRAVFPGSGWSPTVAVTDPTQRIILRAEIDGLIAHLYQLSEEEFQYILNTFPLIGPEIKGATLQSYKRLSAPR